MVFNVCVYVPLILVNLYVWDSFRVLFGCVGIFYALRLAPYPFMLHWWARKQMLKVEQTVCDVMEEDPLLKPMYPLRLCDTVAPSPASWLSPSNSAALSPSSWLSLSPSPSPSPLHLHHHGSHCHHYIITISISISIITLTYYQ